MGARYANALELAAREPNWSLESYARLRALRPRRFGPVNSRLCRRLVKRLNEAGIKVGGHPAIERLYVGYHQRAVGAWVWAFAPTTTFSEALSVGSQWPAAECAREPWEPLYRSDWGDVSIVVASPGVISADPDDTDDIALTARGFSRIEEGT